MKEIEKCPEGGEGVVIIQSSSKNLMPNDYCRCTNNECPIKNECKRWLQTQIDKQNPDENNVSVYAEFCQPISTDTNFDYKKNGCGKFMQL